MPRERQKGRKKAMRTEFDDSVWAHLAGDTSKSYVADDNRQVEVKMIDDRGNELVVVGDIKNAKEAE